ncbi:S26 family signal peptidase [Nonomuraea sp. NPDC048916]|uniref:S26 family signal peptidase n=1 Tax=Nonomuraea sp. NPDC048916 TaxID=3154232 RepID=UPI0034054039
MTAVLAGALLLGGVIAVIVLRRRIVVVSVSGLSMEPTLRHGDRVLVHRAPRETPSRGDVVVIREPGPCRPGDPAGVRGARWVVKRIAAIPGDPEPAFLPAWARHPTGVIPPGCLVVLGDNAELSRDSRHFGAVQADRVLGVASRRLGGGRLSPNPPPSTEVPDGSLKR